MKTKYYSITANNYMCPYLFKTKENAIKALEIEMKDFINSNDTVLTKNKSIYDSEVDSTDAKMGIIKKYYIDSIDTDDGQLYRHWFSISCYEVKDEH